jgi:prepilin-type N-terminal cleavage/methylation domain-containing protein
MEARMTRRDQPGGKMRRHANAAGFSLVELMVAMTVTLIVSGAIYGLLTSGSNAFRREPEVADRQQNIRLAMDLITRDVFNAGAALPTFSQVFTRTDPGGGPCAASVNGCGMAGMMGPAAAAARGGGDPSEDTDVIEMVSTDERCPFQTVCGATTAPGSAGNFTSREQIPACVTLPSLMLLTDNSAFTVQPASATLPAPSACPSGGNSGQNGTLTLGNFLQPWQAVPAIGWPPPAGPPPAPPVVFMYRARVVRYMIAPSTDPQDTSPALWRSESGLYTTAGGPAGTPGSGAPWDLVARGIEDLQIEYSTGNPAVWDNEPPTSLANNWDTMVREVRITLSARVTAANLQGQTRAAGGGAPDALRGQLSTTVAPRAAFNELQMGSQIQ